MPESQNSAAKGDKQCFLCDLGRVFGMNKNLVMGPDGALNEEQLCW
jgi:hypothetical protein